MIIAVDGPAASGKGTLARRLAAHYGLAHLDTGALYRAVARDVLAGGGDLRNEDTAAACAKNLDAETLGDSALRGENIGEAASVVAKLARVRAALLDYQRRFAEQPSGAILDGRDIGTVICPGANAKLFVTASPKVRAWRRWRELKERGAGIGEDEVLADIEARDARDAARETAPMRRAQDALLLDTSDLDIETAFRAAIDLIDTALADSGYA